MRPVAVRLALGVFAMCSTEHAQSSGALAVVVLSRGAAYASSSEITQLCEQVHAALRAQGQTPVRVQAAFVDRSEPALPAALDACADAKADAIVILPVMSPDEPALRRWLHKLVMRWRAGRAHSPQLIFAQPLLHNPQLPQVLAHTVQQLMHAPDTPDVPTVVGDDRWEQDPQGWSHVPEHQHHVLWCVGPRCAAKGAVHMWPKLAKTVQTTPALKDRVQLLQTSCQFPCNHGPLMITYPDGVWYGPMAEDNLARVLTQHVVQGEVDEALHVHGPRVLAHPSLSDA